MSENEKPLPTPPKTPFGRQRPVEQQEGTLLADRIAAAMAEGNLEELLGRELPDNEYARNLAGMMMGMTGMLPFGGEMPVSGGAGQEQETPSSEVGKAGPQPSGAEEVPEDVRTAVESGDVKGLMELLRREHQKRSPVSENAPPPSDATASPAQAAPLIDKDLIDALIGIARDNGVTLDWIILRAIKVYVQEYGKTGRL